MLDWKTLGPKALSEVPAEAPLIGHLLRSSDELSVFVSRSSTTNEPVLLIVNDAHRATRTRAALEALARTLAELGSELRFRALVATGTHRFAERERREFEDATFGGCGLDIADTAWHDADDRKALTELAGVRLHHWLGSSRFLLPIGSCEPHYFAGVTGAHKTITIGCFSRAAIERNHAGAMNPASDVLQLDGNPVFEESVDVLANLKAAGKEVFAINEVVCDHTLLAAAAGDPLTALRELLSTVRRVFLQQIPAPVDVLHLKVPEPLGRNLYQADKALKNNHRAVRDGGGIVLEAKCPEGIGPDAFMGLLERAGDYASAIRLVETEGYRLGDHKAVKLRYLTDRACRGVHVALVSPGISQTQAQAAGMALFAEVAPAVDWLRRVTGGSFQQGLVIEDAGVCCVAPR
ncbi:MAG: DUF2088 domain-containing protein [Planctomycetes bacterium]|nr:DUF2088 domain-containing protein [Planctomycetota bacterium]